jgi:hypothetical protein
MELLDWNKPEMRVSGSALTQQRGIFRTLRNGSRQVCLLQSSEEKSPSREGGTIVFVDEAGFSLLPMLVRPG